MKRFFPAVLGVIILAAGMALTGCGSREYTKTIVLEDKAEESVRNREYVVKNIKEYYYRGLGRDGGALAWEGNSENIAIIRRQASGYMYERVDVDKGKVLEKLQLESRPIRSMKISPDGAYLAYEVKKGDNVSLLLRDVKQGVTTGLGDTVSPSYAWSGDGKRFFYSFMENDTSDFYQANRFSIHCMDPEWHATLQVETVEGSPYTDKSIFSNIDGLKLFIKQEEFESNTEKQEKFKSNTEQNGGMAKYWICQHDKKFLDFVGEDFEPLCFTGDGLFVRKKKGTVFLMEHLEKHEFMKQVLETGEADVFFCKNGDHMFLLEREEETQQIQVQCVALEKGKVKDKWPLYKESFGDVIDVAISPDDSAIAIKSCKHRGGKKYDYKVTVLEYNNMIFS